jgi:hypothetical protein
VALLAIALVTAAIVLRRRRRHHVRIPDTVPDDLVEKEPARI